MAGKRLHIKKGRRLWLLLLLAVVLCPLLRTAEARTTAPETPPGKDTAPPAPTDTVNIDTEGTVPDAPEEQSPSRRGCPFSVRKRFLFCRNLSKTGCFYSRFTKI